MNSIDSEFEEIKKFDDSLFDKSNNEIEVILEDKSIELKRIMQDGKPNFINIVNGYLKVVKYVDFEKEFPNLCRYELYDHEKNKTK